MVVVVSGQLFGQMDYLVESSVRSAPSLGADISTELGYNFLLWGETFSANAKDKNNNKEIMYGIWRPSVKFSSSALINGLQVVTEFLPISLINLSAGYGKTLVSTDFNYFDCQEINCRGFIGREFIRAKSGLALWGFFLLGEYSMEKLSFSDYDKKGRPFSDYANVLLCDIHGEYQDIWEITAGRSFSAFTLGVVHRDVKNRILNGSALSQFLFFKQSKERWSYVVGAGQFRSTQTGSDFLAVFQLTFMGFPSLKLF